MLGLGRHLLYSTRDYPDEVTWWYFLIPVSYAFGIFPTAQLVAGLLGHDPTEEGSGNPGASNVYRVAGAKAGIRVLAGDLMKGFTMMFSKMHTFLVISGSWIVSQSLFWINLSYIELGNLLDGRDLRSNMKLN